jgi:hypothetical protein
MSEASAPQPQTFENPDAAHVLFFLGDAEYWRIFRKEVFGETNRALALMPMVKEGQRHDVAWLERSWANPETGESHTVHHAACPCLIESEFKEGNGFDAMENCDVWQAGILSRAIDINHKNSRDFGQMLSISAPLKDTEHSGLAFEELALDPVDEVMLHHLRIVRKQPYYWEGNVRGGEHQLHLLSVITGYPPTQLTEHARSLADEGWVDFDGEALRLAA